MEVQAYPTSKSEILERIRASRFELDTTLKRVSEAQMTEPTLGGGWCIKDVLSHLASWERMMVGWLNEAQRGEVPDNPASEAEIDAINARIYEENRRRIPEDVRLEFHAHYPKVIQAVESVSEEDLFEAQRYPWRKGSPLWVMVAANTWWHYDEHRQAIEQWLADHQAAG